MSERLGVGFPLLSDPKGEGIRAYGVWDNENAIAWPSIFIVGKDGTIVRRWLADTYTERIATADVIADIP